MRVAAAEDAQAAEVRRERLGGKRARKGGNVEGDVVAIGR